MVDTIVESVIKQFKDRSNVGIKKYGVTLDRNDLTRLDWINHTQQELMDAILYLEKLKTFEGVLKDYPQTQNQTITHPYYEIKGQTKTY